MKILLLCDGMEAGGAETHILTLARGLMREGHTVGLLSYGGALADRLAREGVCCRTIPKIGRNPFAFWSARAILAREVRKKGYDVLHAHTRMSALLARGICNPYMRKSAKIPVFVVTAHAKFRADGFYRRLSVWGEATIAVSEDLRAYLADNYRLPAERVTVIPNGIDEKVFSPAPEEQEKVVPAEKERLGAKGATAEKAGKETAGEKDAAILPQKERLGEKGATAEKAGATDEPTEILFVSRLDSDCSLGAALLCRAALRLWERGSETSSFRVTIAGRGSEFSRLCALAGRVNLLAGRQLVRVIKPKSEDDLVALYRRAAVFVGVSRAAMEASFCGCAVLLCGNEGYGGLLSPDRPDLAAANLTCRGEPLPTEENLCRDLADLLKNPAHCRANAQETSDWMRKTFSAMSAVRATEAVYHTLLARQKEVFRRAERKEEKKGRRIRGQGNGGVFSKARSRRVVIGGYAGCGNLGDDAILQGILLGLRRGGVPVSSVTVLSGQPRRDERRFGVRCVGRKNPFAVLSALLRADIFVSGGGTLLQNRTGKRSLFYYLALLRLARFSGCKTVLFGGVGEISGSISRKAAKNELENCTALLLRDETSALLVRALGVQNPRLSVGADAAFLLPDPPPLRSAFLVGRLTGDLKKPFFCVCPCGGVSLSGLSSFLSQSFSGFYPIFLLCDPARDVFPARALKKRFGGTIFAPRDVSEAAALFSASALVLSSRLHPLILSVRDGARCACFSGGDVKLAAFCRAAGVPLFPADAGGENLPSAAALFAKPAPTGNDFCRKAAKDLAFLCKIVYNGREESPPAQNRGKGRTFYEERAAGGPAPPDHH